MTPGVFLDRDGVLNRVLLRDGLPVGPRTLADFTLTDGSGDHVRRLKAAGYKVVVVTNQPDIARGLLAPNVLAAMHKKLSAEVPLDGIYVCPHSDEDRCACRKPKPGLLLSAAREHAIDLNRSYMVGDRWRDVEAGKAAGCRTLLVKMGYREALKTPPDRVVADLGEAVRVILDEAQR